MATKTPTPITVEGGGSTQPYDRAKAIKQFDESKVGVKGQVDSGIHTVPPFIYPPEILSDLGNRPGPEAQIPTVDLSDIDDSPNFRSAVVEQIRDAASTLGFFQIINHGIPLEVMDRTITSIKAFHDQQTEIKALVHRREMGTGVSYLPNVDVYNSSEATSWRDVLQVRMGPTPFDENEIPEVCRAQVMEWNREIIRLGEILMGFLSEGLGLSSGRLKEMRLLDYRVMVGNYYPPCPQLDLTVRLASHADPKALTVLLQDHIGGLQVRSGEGWLDVRPIPGALIINIGDFLQIISNELYKSAYHRVLANSSKEPRVSVAVFFNPSDRERLFGPLPELTSAEKPALYRNFTLNEFHTRFFQKELDRKSSTNYFRQ